MRTRMAAGLLALVTVTGLVCIARAQGTDPRILKYDRGPAAIDVSGYPQGMQNRYRLFAEKCSACHTLARGINSELVLPAEFERYVKRMMRQSGDLMSADQAKQIYDFLVFDAKIRKRVMYERKLSQSGGKDGF